MKNIVFVLLLSCSLQLFADSEQGKEYAKEVLEKSDEIRNPDKPFAVTLKLEEYKGGVLGDTMELIVHSKKETGSGEYRSLALFVKPLRDKNKLMLRNGNEIWFYDPAASNSIRLSPQQRLLGQASIGDVMVTNFSLDYFSKIIDDEIIKDANRKSRKAIHMELEAKTDSANYGKIDYWLDSENYQPIKAKFYAASGKLMKIAYYRSYKQQLGKKRPAEVLVIDGIDTKKVTRIKMSDYRYVDLPNAMFQRSYLPRFKKP